jgi:hypothetical protein
VITLGMARGLVHLNLMTNMLTRLLMHNGQTRNNFNNCKQKIQILKIRWISHTRPWRAFKWWKEEIVTTPWYLVPKQLQMCLAFVQIWVFLTKKALAIKLKEKDAMVNYGRYLSARLEGEIGTTWSHKLKWNLHLWFLHYVILQVKGHQATGWH